MVTFAHDGLAAFAAWAIGALVFVVAVLVAVFLLLLAELRRLSAAWSGLLATTDARAESLVTAATGTARNIERITGTIRGEVERLGNSFGGLAGGVEQASAELQKRLRDLLALLDVAQAEAEDAVLEVASSVRALRANAGGFLLSQLRRGPTRNSAEDGVARPGGVASPDGGSVGDGAAAGSGLAAEASQAAAGDGARTPEGSRGSAAQK